MKFISFDHLWCIVMTTLVMVFLTFTNQEVRLIDCIMFYGIMLANVQVMRLERK